MIRFVDLGRQIYDERQFAWFDTVTDKFLSFQSIQIWESWEDFSQDFREAGKGIWEVSKLSRFWSLFPKDWEKKSYDFGQQDQEGEWTLYQGPFFEYNDHWGIPEGAD